MISFIHYWDENSASYRYRAMIPSRELNVKLNNYDADVLVFCKPHENELEFAKQAKSIRKIIIVDFCDNHFVQQPHYKEFAKLAHLVTCPTKTMSDLIHYHTKRESTVIVDPYEFPEETPHCHGTKLLWFGHASNMYSLRYLNLNGYDIKVISNTVDSIPWSLTTLKENLKERDIVLMPATAAYKSPNRTIEAIRMGCFVVAENHPSLTDFPVWKGDIREGIEWARRNPEGANEITKISQDFIRERYSPRTQASAWKNLLGSVLTSEVVKYDGPIGFPLTSQMQT